MELIRLVFLGSRSDLVPKINLIASYFIAREPTWRQGCQMVYFSAKNPNLGIFWRAL
jgi:hypothetical protein